MKTKTNKLARLERHRFSVFTGDLTKCYFCGRPKDDLHELLGGRNRLNSIEYGYVLPVCRQHHSELHNNHDLTLRWKKECQNDCQNRYGYDVWMADFKRNYLD